MSVIQIKGDASVKGLLRNILETGKAKAVFTLCKTGAGFNYLFITDPAKLDDAVPLSPIMPVNAASLLSKLTIKGPMPGAVAVVLRPCELRAFAELVKREQAARENFIFISPVCGGVLTFKDYADDKIEDATPGYWKAYAKNEIAPGIRETCGACEQFIPFNADITVLPIDDSCEFYLNTPRAVELVEGIDGDMSDSEFDESAFNSLAELRKVARKELTEQLDIENFGVNGLVEFFGKCLGCHGCMNICPICYCNLCAFDSKENEFTPAIFENELAKRNSMRVPPNTIFFQLGRISHMAISCVGCGMCSDVCPADIPVTSLFLKLGDEIQAIFEYLPGKDFDEPLPLSTFEENELAEVEG